jgi:amidophosphoribosyltransferase
MEEIRAYIGCDALIYQDVDAMKRAVAALNPALQGFEASCFDGRYITGDVSAADFDAMQAQRLAQPQDEDAAERGRLALPNASES